MDDVGVVERRGGAGLAVEAIDVGLVEGLLGGQHLDRDAAPELRVFGEEHLPHAAGADLVEDAVRAEFEPAVLPLEDEPRLERGEDAGLDEARGGVRGGRRDRSGFGKEAGKHVVVGDLGAAHECEDRVAGTRWFGHTPSTLVR